MRNQLKNHKKYGKVILIMRTKLTLPRGDNIHEKGTFFQIFVTSKQATFVSVDLFNVDFKY